MVGKGARVKGITDTVRRTDVDVEQLSSATNADRLRTDHGRIWPVRGRGASGHPDPDKKGPVPTADCIIVAGDALACQARLRIACRPNAG